MSAATDSDREQEERRRFKTWHDPLREYQRLHWDAMGWDQAKNDKEKL